MGKQEALYLLIKSLQPGEKSLVRQSDSGKSGYMALFDTIARQRQYDERKAKKKLIQQGIDINFAYAKNYLTKHILRVLRDARESPATGLARQMLDIEILLERKIFAIADPLIDKAMDAAWKEERFAAYLKLSGHAIQRVLRTGQKVDENIVEIEQLNARRSEARSHLFHLGELEDLFYTYQPISKRKRNARNQIDLALVEQYRRDPRLAADARPASVRGQRMYLRCLTHILAFAGDFETSLQRRQEFLALFQEHDFLLRDHPVEYLNELVALGGLQIYFAQYDDCLATLAKIHDFQTQNHLHGSEMFDKYFRLLLGHAQATGDHSRVKAHLTEIEEGLVLYADSLPWTSLSMLYFFLARFQFDQGDFSATRQWTEVILSRTNGGVREDITSLARILTIFTHYEDQDFELVEAQSRATRKYLRRRDQLYRFESRILSFLEHNSFHITTAAHQSALVELQQDLAGIFEDRQEAAILSYFDILAWLEGKINSLN